MILVVSHEGDADVSLVTRELERSGAPYLRFDTDGYPESASLELSVRAGEPRVILGLEDAEHDLSAADAVLHRHTRLPVAPGIAERAARELAEAELRATLEGALFALPARTWVNHPHAKRRARSKPLQLALAARAGLRVPETRITADPAEVRALHQIWDGVMIAKLVGGQPAAADAESQYAIRTTMVERRHLEREQAISACPAIYQRYVEKAFELRVTVVGERLFAARLDSQASPVGAIDWRRAGPDAIDVREHRLDQRVATRCLGLARELGLELAGIDLIVTPDGETVFLEINTAPQWAWVERRTGSEIASAIAERLIAAAR